MAPLPADVIATVFVAAALLAIVLDSVKVALFAGLAIA